MAGDEKQKKLIVLIWCLLFTNVFVFTPDVQASQVPTGKVEAVNSESAALDFVRQFILTSSLTDPDCPWDEKTVIDESVPLYDLNEVVNGYVCVLKNGEKEAGNIQVSLIDGEVYLVAFTFEGGNMLDSMLQTCASAEAVDDSHSAKIIYNGGMDYLIKKDGAYLYLASQASRSVLTRNELQADYAAFKARMRQERESLKAEQRQLSTGAGKDALASKSGTVIKKYVYNTINSDEMVIQDDWRGRTLNGTAINDIYNSGNPNAGTCGPTTGTNLIKYWALKRNVNALDCPYNFTRAEKDWWIASGLMVRMGMNMTDGTTTIEGVYSGLKSYSTSVRGVQYSGSDCVTKPLIGSNPVTFQKARNTIDSNVPFGLVTSGHISACFGYYITASGEQQVILQDTMDRVWYFYTFSSLYPWGIVYVRWN